VIYFVLPVFIFGGAARSIKLRIGYFFCLQASRLVSAR